LWTVGESRCQLVARYARSCSRPGRDGERPARRPRNRTTTMTSTARRTTAAPDTQSGRRGSRLASKHRKRTTRNLNEFYGQRPRGRPTISPLTVGALAGDVPRPPPTVEVRPAAHNRSGRLPASAGAAATPPVGEHAIAPIRSVGRISPAPNGRPWLPTASSILIRRPRRRRLVTHRADDSRRRPIDGAGR
jgi:hypothetical protein